MSSKASEVVSLEYTSVKVPYEVLNKKFRQAQKIIDREIAQLNTQITHVTRLPTPELQRQAMSALKEKLQNFRCRVGQTFYSCYSHEGYVHSSANPNKSLEPVLIDS